MKLKHIHIDRYKLFHDFDIDFCAGKEPLSLVVIAGVNGSGKSTLLQYIRPHKMAIPPTGRIDVWMRDGEELSFQIPPSPVQSNAYKQAFENVLYFAANDTGRTSGQLEKVLLKYVDRCVYEEGRSSFEAYREIQAMLDTIFADFHLQVRFKGLNADRHPRFVSPDGTEVGVDDLSDGERQLLAKLFPLFMADMQGRVVLMDEPDSSMHPAWQSYLVPVLRRCAKEKGCQFILATHSPQVIASVRREELRILTREAEGTVRTVRAETCEEGPYGWTVERVLDEIQDVPLQRAPEVEKKLADLRKMVQANQAGTETFAGRLKELEVLLGYSDPELVLIRMEMMRKRKEEAHETCH